MSDKKLKLDNQHIDIIFTKGGEKPSSALMKRFDGSEVFVQYKNDALALHDLAHFAVESALMIRAGFYWLINSGLQPSDFELPKDQQPPLLQSALKDPDNIAIEYIVNQILVETTNSGPIDNFIEVLDQGMVQNGAAKYTFPLTDVIIEDIRELFTIMYEAWNYYPEGKSKAVMVFFPDEDDRIEA